MARTRALTLWFTGLPCSGKTTLAQLLATRLGESGHANEVLDGDVIRKRLWSDLGFSREDRDKNVSRIGILCELLTRHGVIAIVAAVSPYRSSRDAVRTCLEGRFVEIYTRCPVATCAARDVKGMYASARAGKIKGFTGVDDGYEPPLNAELVLETGEESEQDSLSRIIDVLHGRGLAIGR